MNLPQWALDLLPANLGGGADAVELPDQAPVTVSPWAESVVEEAETQKLFPYRIYDLLGRDFTRNITRFEFALLAVRTYELLANDYDTLSVTTYKDPELGQSDTLFFRDCKDEDYIVDDTMSKAYNLGIISGYSKPWPTFSVGENGKIITYTNDDGVLVKLVDWYDVNVGPNDPITREQAAAMLARLAEALGKPLPAAGSTPFTDTVSDWAQENVAQVYNAGIMTGTSDTTFSAKSNYTIEQSIATMVRMAEYVNQ